MEQDEKSELLGWGWCFSYSNTAFIFLAFKFIKKTAIVQETEQWSAVTQTL